METMETIDIPQKAQETVKRLIQQRDALNNTLQSYLQGVSDSLCLEGDWTVDPTVTKFVKVEAKPKEPEPTEVILDTNE